MNPLNHVAIIMDGNGRWGLKNKNSRNLGHKEGLKTVEQIIEATIKKEIKYLTLFAFSTENWKRPNNEINYLFELLEKFLKKKINYLNKEKIRLIFLGNKNFNKRIKKLLNISEKITKNNERLQINLALNYGSRDEITNSIRLLIKKNEKINLLNISKNLYTKNIPDPDILIRTGNTKRLSNFLLWQLAYTEIFFERKLWPDFTKFDFNKIINKFKKIKRNFGSI